MKLYSLTILFFVFYLFFMPLPAKSYNKILKEKLATVSPKPYMRNPDSSNVYDRQGNYVSAGQAAKDPSFWNKVEVTPTAPFTPLDSPAPSYARQTGTNEVYDVSSKLPRYVSFEEAQKNNIWDKVKENKYLYSPYKGIEIYRKKESDADYPEYGKYGGYINFGEPSKAYVKDNVPVEKMRAILAHELGHWFTRKWYRDQYINDLGYADKNENSVISLSEDVANDYEAYKMGELKDKKKIDAFKKMEQTFK